jgi:hypothetical protein
MAPVLGGILFQEVPGVGGKGRPQPLCGVRSSTPVGGKSGNGVGEELVDIDVGLAAIQPYRSAIAGQGTRAGVRL